ncbi:alpha/beta fold hydrolase [Rhizobium cremeum]|uniref:alpha/beta fold hydrolase n=1 Tax=Rhizobium cremeum TaxID=2813827 RepID=UPI000DE49BCC
MNALSKISCESVEPVLKPALSAARPVTFSGTVGLFMPPAAPRLDLAVLFVSPWGLEELCVHKFWRMLGDGLSAKGIASFRFDYSGTGDALDIVDGAPSGLARWENDIVEAAAQLRALSGCGTIAVVSQGLGSMLALRVLERLGSTAGIACLAPVASGRTHLRELQIWSRMVDEGLGVPEKDRVRDRTAIGGLFLPEDIVSDLRKAGMPEVAVRKALVALRPDRPGDKQFAETLRGAGADICEIDYVGYDAFVSNPLISVVPEGVGERLIAWVSSLCGPSLKDDAHAGAMIASPAELAGRHFRELPVTFGENGRLYGVLCQPLGKRRGATTIILGTAYDRHAGWGRSGVEMARQLASEGIASLRFDAANVGDSPPVPGGPGQILYHPSQLDDVEAALDFLEKSELLPAVICGRCSGSYLGFRSVVADPRLKGAVIANPYAFQWDPALDVDVVIHSAPRQLHEYRSRMLKLETFRRLLRREVDVLGAATNMVRAVLRRLKRYLLPVLNRFSHSGSLHSRIIGEFQMLLDRNTSIDLIYSEDDVGLVHLAEHFGEGGRGLSRYPNVRMTILPDADHNLTPVAAREAYLRAVQDMAVLKN